jgi:hypothetical protein
MSRHPFREAMRTGTGVKALLADLHKADKKKEVQACAEFLNRGLLAWRRQDSLYQPTTDGLYKALKDELRRMAHAAECVGPTGS